MGAGDEVPQALQQLGADVMLLGADDLASGNLSRFDAIVTGVRAYNVRADLRANQGRLLDYVKNGGTLVVQYNVADGRNPFGGETSLLANIGPYPITTGSERVTVEEAPVQFLIPPARCCTSPTKLPRAISTAGFRSAASISRRNGTSITSRCLKRTIRWRSPRPAARCTRATARARMCSPRSPGFASCPPEFRAHFASSRIC